MTQAAEVIYQYLAEGGQPIPRSPLLEPTDLIVTAEDSQPQGEINLLTTKITGYDLAWRAVKPKAVLLIPPAIPIKFIKEVPKSADKSLGQPASPEKSNQAVPKPFARPPLAKAVTKPRQSSKLSFEVSNSFEISNHGTRRKVGLALVALSLGGLVGPLVPNLRLEASLAKQKAQEAVSLAANPPKPLPAAAPVVFDPLVTPDGSSIAPVNQDFSLIIPKVGINAPVIASVDPAKPGGYLEALKEGVAHAATSFLPDEDGTVYLFSHSTNYDWFVRDLNAVFYHLKNLAPGDLIVIYYKGTRYTYRITDKKVVRPRDITYIVPVVGAKSLILQTCWPPGSTAQRLLIFADLIEELSTQV